MTIRNIWKDVPEPLEMFTDERGTITDVLYKDRIEHMAVVTSNPNVIRGNHYHKNTMQHMLIVKGSFVYWWKDAREKDEVPKSMVCVEGDLITTPPYEIHALQITDEGNEFIEFGYGQRGGKDYESDTFRVESIIG